MEVGDLAAVEALGAAFHIHHPEGSDIAPERRSLAPEFCFVLEQQGEFAGYCIAHPWGGSLPPGLNTRIGRLPDPVDRLHLHDVVLHEHARGKRHTPMLLNLLSERALARGLASITLIAVGGAGAYWSRAGFSNDPDLTRQRFVRHSYGADSTPMVRTIAAA